MESITEYLEFIEPLGKYLNKPRLIKIASGEQSGTGPYSDATEYRIDLTESDTQFDWEKLPGLTELRKRWKTEHNKFCIYVYEKGFRYIGGHLEKIVLMDDTSLRYATDPDAMELTAVTEVLKYITEEAENEEA